MMAANNNNMADAASRRKDNAGYSSSESISSNSTLPPPLIYPDSSSDEDYNSVPSLASYLTGNSTVLCERSVPSVGNSDFSGTISFACDDAVRVFDARLCLMRVYIANTVTCLRWPTLPALMALASTAEVNLRLITGDLSCFEDEWGMIFITSYFLVAAFQGQEFVIHTYYECVSMVDTLDVHDDLFILEQMSLMGSPIWTTLYRDDIVHVPQPLNLTGGSPRNIWDGSIKASFGFSGNWSDAH